MPRDVWQGYIESLERRLFSVRQLKDNAYAVQLVEQELERARAAAAKVRARRADRGAYHGSRA